MYHSLIGEATYLHGMLNVGVIINTRDFFINLFSHFLFIIFLPFLIRLIKKISHFLFIIFLPFLLRLIKNRGATYLHGMLNVGVTINTRDFFNIFQYLFPHFLFIIFLFFLIRLINDEMP